MPERLFFELGEEKRARIFDAALNEFAVNGYGGSSTNRIVKACGISKGGLFLYFSSKEELYLYVLDTVIQEQARDMELGEAKLPREVFSRITEYSAMEISWYIKNPMKGRLIIRAFSDNDGALSAKIMEKYAGSGENICRRLMDGADCGSFRNDRNRAADIIEWVLAGFNSAFLKESYDSETPFEKLKEEYLKKLSPYIEILRGML